jgi:creatinine amidohydrolase
MTSEVLYTHLLPEEFRQRIATAPIAYLPLGTLEWHGEHLPFGADGLQAQGFFVDLAKAAGGVVLPMLFLGPDISKSAAGQTFYGMDIVGFPKGQPRQLDGSAYWVKDDLFASILEAVLSQLARTGFRIVVAHGHGPSTKYFRDNIETWQARYNLRLFHCWDPSAGMDDELGIQMDHAAANETSLMMALHPDLVHLENLFPDPGDWPMAIIGKDPRQFASAEKGRQAIRKQASRMAALLRAELDAIKLQNGRQK